MANIALMTNLITLYIPEVLATEKEYAFGVLDNKMYKGFDRYEYLLCEFILDSVSQVLSIDIKSYRVVETETGNKLIQTYIDEVVHEDALNERLYMPFDLNGTVTIVSRLIENAGILPAITELIKRTYKARRNGYGNIFLALLNHLGDNLLSSRDISTYENKDEALNSISLTHSPSFE